jgi:hypothetical protein
MRGRPGAKSQYLIDRLALDEIDPNQSEPATLSHGVSLPTRVIAGAVAIPVIEYQ